MRNQNLRLFANEKMVCPVSSEIRVKDSSKVLANTRKTRNDFLSIEQMFSTH